MSVRSFHHAAFSAERIAAERRRRGLSVSVCLPARECVQTVGEIVAALGALRDAGAIDEVVVIDAASGDGTARVAREAGAEVHQEAELMPVLGPVLGKGDAMYRALSVLTGDVICYLDADTAGFSAHFATGLLGPLVCEPPSPPGGEEDATRTPTNAAGDEKIAFVKAFYRRPFRHDGVSLPEGGGRVNHLMARPALGLFYPELAGIRQPLAGEVAARRELLERVPFATGYGVEIAMLIDVWREVGLGGIAQVDLEEHRNRHQPLAALAGMAGTVLRTVVERARADGRLDAGPRLGGPDLDAEPPVERPPLAGTRAATEAGTEPGTGAARGIIAGIA